MHFSYYQAMRYRLVFAFILSMGLVSPGTGGGGYGIEKYTIDNGGGRMIGGTLSVEGTIGQPDAQPVPARGGSYEVKGGYWAQSDPTFLFIDGFEE